LFFSRAVKDSNVHTTLLRPEIRTVLKELSILWGSAMHSMVYFITPYESEYASLPVALMIRVFQQFLEIALPD
jgi:hypothetical protein